MSTNLQQQWLRTCSLIAVAGTKGLDLSQFRIRFSIRAMDYESPNNAEIRVYNLKDSTVKELVQSGEYTQVILQVGYQDTQPGVIFSGSIKQFRRGKETNTDTYLDILAADGDIDYNNAVVSTTVAAGATQGDVINAVVKQMPNTAIGYLPDLTGSNPQALPRSKVMFGMARVHLRNAARSIGATWSLQNGKLVMIPLQGYLPNEAVQVNTQTGMIGMPEQTDLGIRIRTLINPRIQIGQLVQINNKDINQLYGLNGNVVPFDQWAGIQWASRTTDDGYYRAYVLEYEGDTRGNEWYCNMTCLAVDYSSKQVLAKN